MRQPLLFLLLPLLLAQSGAAAQTNGATESALLDGYRAIHFALTQDHFSDARQAAQSLETTASEWLRTKPAGDPQRENVALILKGSADLQSKEAGEDIRTAFAILAQGVVQFLKRDTSLQTQWQLFFCPMAEHYGYWVQPKGEGIANPYFGQEMPGCGVKKKWTAI